MSIQATLDQREKQHGSFETHAEIESYLARAPSVNYNNMTDVQKIGLQMILHKVSRILNNGHNHIDSWHDIAGYATLVEQHMQAKVGLHNEIEELDNRG